MKEKADKEGIFVTIDHLNDFNGFANFRVGDVLRIEKDYKNYYDDEALLVYNQYDAKCGYVANSVTTVARGTYSAGRIYDKFTGFIYCTIRFFTEDFLICELNQFYLKPEIFTNKKDETEVEESGSNSTDEDKKGE